MKPTEPSLNNYSNKESCCKYPFVAAFIYARMRISRILGAYNSELDRKKQIFLKHTLGTSFLSGMAFTICEVCT